MPKQILVITGSRAEWGLLQPVCRELANLKNKVTVLFTASHLAAPGDPVEAEAAGNFITVRVPTTPLNSELSSERLMFLTLGNTFIELPETLRRISPDLVIVLGDRYEIFAAASICRLCGIRLAHISGGELTAGAVDDCLRHCITKLSDLHFTATETYRKRVIQLGENPDFVFNVGELALADLSSYAFAPLDQLEKFFAMRLQKFFLITVHPETCNPGEGEKIIGLLNDVFLTVFDDYGLIFTSANADPEGDRINNILTDYLKVNAKARFVASLGRHIYLSTARLAKCVIGNSSSGIAEIPALGTPVINIGRRQHGRPHGRLVQTVEAERLAIVAAIKKSLQPEFCAGIKSADNPYEGENSARKIAETITCLDLASLTSEKGFYDL